MRKDEEGGIGVTKKRNISAMIAFCVLAVGFVVMNWLDSMYMWDRLMWVRYRGLRQAWWKWWDVKGGFNWYRFFMTLPGVLFATFPLLAVGFAGKRKKIPAVIFAALNLLCTGLLFVVESVVFSACWAVYAAAGVVLLLYALGVIQRKTLPVILFFVLGVASVAATVTLSFYRVGSDWSPREAHISAFERYGMRAIWNVKMCYGYGYASILYPLSRAFLYFALGAGALAFRGKEEPRKVNRPVQAVRPVVMQPVQSAAESLRKLEQLARLHDMGALTDEEFAQKKEELLKRM